jgi:hypothetical protein
MIHFVCKHYVLILICVSERFFYSNNNNNENFYSDQIIYHVFKYFNYMQLWLISAQSNKSYLSRSLNSVVIGQEVIAKIILKSS